MQLINKEKETNIDIQNEIKGTENSGAECWNALGKTQKDYAYYLPAISSFYVKQLEKIAKASRCQR